MTEEYDPNYNGFANYGNDQDYNPYSSLEGYNDATTTSGTDYASYSNSHSNETEPTAPATTSRNQDSKRRRDFDEGKLFIGGLSWDTTDDGLNEYFGQFGKMIDSVVMKDGAGKSRGFAFVTYEDPAVVRAVMAKESHVIDNKQVDPKPAIAREIQVKAEKMFVGSIPPSVSEADLTAYFTRFGKPMDVSLMIDHETGISRGFAFVTFENDESLRSALSAGPHELGGSVLEVNKALPRRSGGGPFPSSSSTSSFPPSKRDYHYADEQRPSYSSRDRGSGRRGSGGPDRSSRYKGTRNDYYSSGSDYAAYPSSHYSSRSSGSSAAGASAASASPPPPHAPYAYPSPNQAYHGYPPYYYDPSSYYSYPQYDPSSGESSYASPSAGSGSYYPPPYPGYYAPPYPMPPPSGGAASASSESMMPEGKGSDGAINKSGPYPPYPSYYPPPPSHYSPYPPPPLPHSHSHSHSHPSHASPPSYNGGGSGGNASRAPPVSHSRPYSNSSSHSGNYYGDRDRDRDRDRDGDRDGKPNHSSNSKPTYHPYSKR